MPDTPYDIYFTPGLEPGFYWRLQFRGATNQTEFNVARPPSPRGFFIAASAVDSDEDGLTDGYETLVTKTDPANPDSNGNEIWDGYEDFDGDGLRNLDEFSLRTNPFNADSNESGVSDGPFGGDFFLTDGVDNNGDGQIDEATEGLIAAGPNLFGGELKLPGKLRGDNQVGATNQTLLLPFVVYLTTPEGTPVPNGTPVSFSAFNPSGANVSHLLSNTTDWTGSNGFPGQAQTFLTLGPQIGTYRVRAEWITNAVEFRAETITPLGLQVTGDRYEPPTQEQVVLNTGHFRFTASGADTNLSHVIGVRLSSGSNPGGITFALYETAPGSGLYVGSVATATLRRAPIGHPYTNRPPSTPVSLDDWGGRDEGVEYASADHAARGTGNYTDSDEFDWWFNLWNAIARGSARSPTNAVPPFVFDPSFLKAAGFEPLAIEAGATNVPGSVKNQADFLYVSTHGLHDQNTLLYPPDPPGTWIGPAIFRGEWKDDLMVVILAGCSVLDVTGDKWPGNTNRPGKAWLDLGPCYYLGYEGGAPSDVSGLPRQIMQDFALYWQHMYDFGEPTQAWMQVNGNRSAWNACAIEVCRAPRAAWHWKYRIFIGYRLEMVEEENW